MKSERSKTQRQASILVGVLWCLALLSVVVIGVLHTARLDLLVMKNYGDRVQAHYLALAGIEKAKALLFQDAKDRSRNRKSHTGELHDAPLEFRDVAFGRGHFRVFRRGRTDEHGGIKYGVSDEESRLNVNSAATNELANLRGMTPDIIAAIVDWRDADNAVTPGGAEAEYYAALKPASLPRNGPLQSTGELLMIRGVTREAFLGEDSAQAGHFENDEPDETDNPGAVLEDAGWSGLLTVDSSIRNVSAGGEDRVNVQTADEAALTAVKGITADIAKAIISYRGQQQFASLADLLDVPAVQNQAGARGVQTSQSSQSNQSANQSAATGPKVVSQQLLMDIADDVTIDSNQRLVGMINVNSASLDVLACLPGLNRDLAQAVISERQSGGFFPNIAWLLKVPGLTPEIFKQMAPRVSARSETFRILCEGRVDSTGSRRRIEVIVRVGPSAIDTLSYREGL